MMPSGSLLEVAVLDGEPLGDALVALDDDRRVDRCLTLGTLIRFDGRVLHLRAGGIDRVLDLLAEREATPRAVVGRGLDFGPRFERAMISGPPSSSPFSSGSTNP